MLALSIRQPYVELILRGIKTIEYRSKPTKIIGQRFWIYASKASAVGGRQSARGVSAGIESLSNSNSKPLTTDNLSAEVPPPWILELAEAMRLFPGELVKQLPRGLIVGSAVVQRCEVMSSEWPVVSEKGPGKFRSTELSTQAKLVDSSTSVLTSHNSLLTTFYQWHLTDIERLATPMKPTRQPQPVWFRAFDQ